MALAQKTPMQDSLAAIQQRIYQNIKSFDICALLKLLSELGYQREDIYFQSNADLSSRSSLCEGIIFSEFSYPKVTIILNIGLLSNSSPLPSFFRKKMDSGLIDPELFTRFLNFFDHHTISTLLSMSMPEANNSFFLNWRETQYQYLQLLAINSSSTLWHLFQLCFPELIIQVVKAPRMIRMDNSSTTTLGITLLGKDSILGKYSKQTTPSFKIILTTEETQTDQLKSWPVEIKKRVREIIFPIFQRTDIHLRIILVIKNNKETARLSFSSQLGYCRIGESNQPLKLLLFAGYPRLLAPHSKTKRNLF